MEFCSKPEVLRICIVNFIIEREITNVQIKFKRQVLARYFMNEFKIN